LVFFFFFFQMTSTENILKNILENHKISNS
jgi:hypothetical protein